MANVSAEERKRIKGMGILSNNDGEHFSARIITENGVLNYKQLRNLSEAAEKFGNGDIYFTSRLTLEVPGIKYEDVEPFREYIKAENMITGGTGSRVRPVVACKGTVCTYGIYDTQKLAKKIHDRFYTGYYDVKLPHKFKIAVGGCPNNCVKPDLNDFGIMGQRVPTFDEDQCSGCKKCAVEAACPIQAAKLTDGVLEIDSEICNNCGLCVGKCPFDAVEEKMTGYKVFIGGRWGKYVRKGSLLSKVLTEDELLSVLEKTILFYREQGKTGERFGATIDRLGLDFVEAAIMSDEILERKQEILDAKLHLVGGATC